MEQVELKRLRAIIVTWLDEELAEELVGPRRVEVMNAWGDLLKVAVRQDVLGREIERIEHSYPADWWQAFKARWFPRWALKRWPVMERTIRLVARELYPKLAMPDQEWAISLDESVV